MSKKLKELSYGIQGWLSNYKLWHFLCRPFRRIKGKYRNYKLRHLCIGKVKQLEKTGYDRFEIVNISWDVHWMMNTYLAVIIRDYLRFFIKNTQVIGQCVIDEHKEEYHTANSSFSEEHTKTLDRLFQEWKDLVNSIADEFDELVKINTGDGYDIQTYPEYYEKVEVLSKKAFADLAYIYPDLWW